MASRFPLPRRQTAGFTLLEVMVALFIVGVALASALRATASLAQTSASLRSNLLATWAAENRLVQIRLAHEYPAMGKHSSECPQAELKLFCEEVVEATPNINFRKVEVNVYEDAEMKRKITTLVQLVSANG